MQDSGTLICPADLPIALPRSSLRTWVETLLLACLFLLFITRALIPAWSHLDSDFANYYLAARLYRQGYPVERVYDWTWFQRQKDHAAIERPLVGFAPSTLSSALLVLPLTSLPPLQANRCWLGMSLAFLLLAAALLKRITHLAWRRIGLLIFLAVAPLHNNFRLGQVHIVVLLLLTLAARLHFRNSHFLSGVSVAAAAAMKIYPAFFLLFFLLKRQWRAAAGLVCGLLGALLLSLQLFGAEACRIYFRDILPWGLRGEIIDPYTTGWDSLNALLRRLFIFEPELNPAPVAHLPSLYAFLHSLILPAIFVPSMWAMSRTSSTLGRQKLEWATYGFLLLLLSSEPLPYHFLLLILTAALVIDYFTERRQAAQAGLFVLLYTLACVPYDRLYRAVPRGWTSLLFFPRLYCMLLLSAFLLWTLLSPAESFNSRLRSRSAILAAVAFVVMAASGFVLDLRHLRGLFDNYSNRISASVGSAIAVDPVVTSDSVFFGALVPTFTSAHDAYTIRRFQAALTTSYGGAGDWFHPAATADGRRTWAEIASTKSRVVRFDSDNPAASNPITEVPDAEQPFVSANGDSLAYIREVAGRGGLWIHSLAHDSADRQIAGPEYDVREAAFSPQDEIVFSSWHRDRYRIYSADLQSGAVAELLSIICSARFPSISPDGQWIAFGCERGGVWQLVVMNRRSGEQHQLTNADCNSITPSWSPDSRELIYATDCGRALGITALSKLSVKP
ncbi:MAG TPA: glycosyltransferase 87 family protein [Candidatus Sulfotelmatobacter sp.]|nr:glycosyltransferase 87 family protein [Candidatus Sulfotelmatobacter sp.]